VRVTSVSSGPRSEVIQEILGHSTITITADLYAHVMMGAKRQAAAQMDAMLGEPNDADAIALGRATGIDAAIA
jgi:hypothetical protein